MHLITKNSKNSQRLSELVDYCGGRNDEPFFFCWENDLTDYSGAISDMTQALLALTQNANDEVAFANVPAKALKALGWDIQGTMWQNAAVIVFVRQ